MKWWFSTATVPIFRFVKGCTILVRKRVLSHASLYWHFKTALLIPSELIKFNIISSPASFRPQFPCLSVLSLCTRPHKSPRGVSESLNWSHLPISSFTPVSVASFDWPFQPVPSRCVYFLSPFARSPASLLCSKRKKSAAVPSCHDHVIRALQLPSASDIWIITSKPLSLKGKWEKGHLSVFAALLRPHNVCSGWVMVVYLVERLQIKWVSVVKKSRGGLSAVSCFLRTLAALSWHTHMWWALLLWASHITTRSAGYTVRLVYHYRCNAHKWQKVFCCSNLCKT